MPNHLPRLSETRTRRGAVTIAMIAVATAMTTLSAPASAQDAQQDAGHALFDQGVALFNKGSYEAACAKLEASLKEYAGIGTRGKLAECYEKLGRYASAWQAYREVAQLSMRSGEPTRERVAAERAKALEPKLSYVTVIVPPGRDINGLVVKRGGQEIEHGKLGVAEPVDAGTVAIEVSAPGRKTVTSQLTAAQGQSVKFEVPILLPLTSANPPPVAPPPPPPSPEEPLPVRIDPPSWQKPVGLVVAGAGVVGLGVGAIFGLSAGSTYDSAFDGGGCDRATKSCDAPGQTQVDDARSKATLSTVLFGAGGALVVIGTVVFLTAPSSKPYALRVSPTTYAGGGGITLGGAL
jgi:hypothetical protein